MNTLMLVKAKFIKGAVGTCTSTTIAVTYVDSAHLK